MPKEKIYKCYMCHKVLDHKPHRLVYQEFERSRYYNIFNFDFCDKCFKTYRNWLEKHKEV